ncbi:ATP-binding protein [Alkalibacillus haloalkaliphilus]|uniref:ATP-binding protein n=1 Tax=Alkalibacillus haloalkaliphilus TaxID=94136 RepID=UPI0029357A45|nr:MoxR family ATPase [Alkalibacillus haloalkaliphilus]MDV2582024.1 MoxR family ATPase [Alkalibacillus haloalkaliphilus]
MIKQYKNKGETSFDHLKPEGGYIPYDKDLLTDAVVALAQGKNILLKGPTGSGKTKLAETLANLFNQPMFSVNCSVDLDAESFLGFKTLDYDENGKQQIDFVPGPLVQSMEHGHFLYIDEVNMAKPETLPLINGALDYRRTVTNPLTNALIQAKEGFTVIAAINEGYIGTTRLNEALKNRFIVFDVSYIEGQQLRYLIENNTNLEDEQLIKQFIQLSADLIEAAGQGKISEDAASIRALLDACDLATFIPAKRAITRSIADKLEDEREKEVVHNLASTLFE